MYIYVSFVEKYNITKRKAPVKLMTRAFIFLSHTYLLSSNHFKQGHNDNYKKGYAHK